jgi:hypothetical protein
MEARHEFYIEWGNHPIALIPGGSWRVIETRVSSEIRGARPHRQEVVAVFQHLVERA